ncbi:MAG: Ribosome hibernation promoting factor Hpf [uncultured Nocardioidaceae bacterium]|uniref:Ribosome hibernation promoting factor n=1 Tax=uncultured Nocardioidaceae bacterium TaxID=253824 RepID=A0A6J4LK47_9ACTN|nr:MAG: Ribosome hibernation promoting factor Hpf [uncultured Nocardioidaceae bacterium]
MDIVVKGRNVEVPDHYREHVAQKLAPSERLDSRVIRFDVELAHEKNPRQSDRCQRVEITCYSKGPVIRAEACAADFYAALDTAVLKLEARLRKAHDRRRVHHGRHTPASVAEATAGLPVGVPIGRNGVSAETATETVAVLDAPEAPVDDTASLIVRDKTHAAEPMTSADALHEMELVGHDFYLYMDADTGLPSVVYRRHGYDYGVIRLQAS